MKIINIEIYQYKLPFNTPLILKNNTLTHRKGLLVKLTNNLQQEALADIAPLPSFSPETLESTKKQVLELSSKLLNLEFDTLDDFSTALEKMLSYTLFPALHFALEYAVMSFFHPNDQAQKKIPISALITSKQQVKQGYSAIKLKLAHQPINEAIAFVENICRNTPKETTIRLDINRSWTLKEASTFLSHFPHDTFEYIEEPLSNPLNLALLSEQFSHPIAFDESLIDMPLEALLQVKHKHAFILKPTLLGSFSYLSRLIKLANQHQLKSVFSSAFESGIGILMLTHLTSYFNLPQIPMGFDTYSYFKEDLLLNKLSIKEGYLHLQKPILNRSLLEKIDG